MFGNNTFFSKPQPIQLSLLTIRINPNNKIIMQLLEQTVIMK